MPKKLTYEQKHLRNLLRLEKRIDKLFQEAAARVAHLSESVEGFSADDVFTFDKYPYLRNRANKLVAELNNAVETTIFDGVRLEWDLANEKNDALARSVLGSAVEHLDGTTRRRYFATNAGACEAFLARRERGLNLSERVWNLSKQFKEEMEMGLDLGLRDGVSAVEMSRTLRRYLQNPTALFRRVRDEHGILHLSQRAAAYHPGRGVYRSAYKNARRLTATEVNIAYRTADHLRMQDLDFVVGVEIQLSENHTCLGADGKPHRFHDICDDLKGKYPKTFKFTGWHPHCRCYATPILKTEEEFDADTQRILQGEEPTEGSENAVDDLPDEFKAWAKENEPRLEAAKARGTLPYFVRDNDALIGGAFAPKKKTLLEIAEERHAKRTKEEEDEIRQRWAARAKEHAEVKSAAAETIKTAADFGEIDALGLAQAVESGQIAKIKAETTKLQSAIEDMKKAEDELSDLIPDAHKWHKEFTLEELKSTHAAVQKKLATFEGMPLEKQADKLKFEAQWVADNKKYSTWKVAESAYKNQYEGVLEKVEWKKVDVQLDDLSSFKTKSPIFKQAIADAKAAQEKGDIAKAKEAIEIAEKKRAELEKKKVKDVIFAEDCYTLERKNAALWERDKKNGLYKREGGDKYFRPFAKADWKRWTKDEREVAFLYTSGSSYINEPLYTTYKSVKHGVHYEVRNSWKDINTLTKMIENSTPFTRDVWLNRGASLGEFIGQFGVDLRDYIGNPEKLVGMIGEQKPFMSTAHSKSWGFVDNGAAPTREVVYNIYCPKGTKGIYTEPYSAYGYLKGKGYKWDGDTDFPIQNELEVILQRGTILRVSKVEYKGGQWFVDLDVLGQPRKDAFKP